MIALTIEVGQRYGYRKQRYAKGTVLRPVLVTKLGPPKSRKCRVQWLDGEYQGLEEWVDSDALLCRWEDAEAYVTDEVRLTQVVDASAHAHKTLEWWAVCAVFWTVDGPFDLSWARHPGVMMVKDFPANVAEYGITASQLLAEPLAFVNRLGTYYAPFSTALSVAQQLCKSNSEEILTKQWSELQAWRKAATTGWYASPNGGRGWDVGLEYAQEHMETQQRVFDLICDWCGREHAERLDHIAALQAEVTRLRGIIAELLDWMQVAAAETRLPWLWAKYRATYAQLNGEPPPKRKRSKRGP